MNASSLLDDPQAARTAGRDALSLLLIDSRNHLLRLLALDESAAALRIAAQAGWHGEHWVARHLQRARGEAADPQGPRLAPIEPQIDAWVRGDARPAPDHLRAWLAQVLDTTLDLLALAEDSDTGLHVWRLALAFEDRCGEALAMQTLQAAPAGPADPAAAARPAPDAERAPERPAAPFTPFPPARPERAPLQLPAQRVQIGSAPGGFVPGNERWAHEVALPEFEIDAQPVSWARFAEFAQDGGYDREDLWTPAGWAWLQAAGRRAPRGVAGWQGGVLLQRGARLLRVPAGQPATGVSRHEAEAWCRWAGRRLPFEAEWEAAACTASHRGFAWGEVLEWVAGSARAWPGGQGLAGETDPLPAAGGQGVLPGVPSGVLRGAPWLSRLRCRHPRARRFALPGADTPAIGFRSCAF